MENQCNPLLREADVQFNRRNYDEALQLVDQAIACDENGYIALSQKVKLLMQIELVGKPVRFAEALRVVDDAIRDRSGDDVESHLWRIKGNALLNQGYRALRKAQAPELNGTGATVATDEGNRYLSEALAAFDRAFALDHSDAGSTTGKTQALILLQRKEEALEAVEAGLANTTDESDVVDLLSAKASVLKTLDRRDDAIRIYRGLTERVTEESMKGGIWSEIAELLITEERFHEAIEACDAAEAFPIIVEHWFIKGNAYMGLKRYDEAEVAYLKSIEKKPDDIVPRINRGMALHKLKRYHDALACYDSALAMLPNYPYALLHKGITFSDMGKMRAAIRLFNRVIKTDQRSTGFVYRKYAFYEKGRLLQKRGKTRAAMECFDKALEIDPEFEAAQKEKRRIQAVPV